MSRDPWDNGDPEKGAGIIILCVFLGVLALMAAVGFLIFQAVT